MATIWMQPTGPLDHHRPFIGRQHRLATRRLQHLIGLCAVLVILSILVAPSAFAAPAVTITETERGVSDTFRLDGPSCAVPGLVTMTFNSVFHVTDRGDRGYQFHITVTGDWLLVGDNGVTYTGHITQHVGENGTNATLNHTLMTSTIMRGDDGSRIRVHGIMHFTVNANGVTTSDIDRDVCHKG
jgi:hypothetical protein